MDIREYLLDTHQHDARRAGDRDRLLLEARRAHPARPRRADRRAPAAPVIRLARLLLRRAAA